MKIIAVEGFVASSINFKESSKILTLITKDKGVITVISKGCKSIKNSLKLVSENLTYAIFHIYYKENGMSTLIAGDVLNYFPKIKSDITLISYYSYLLDLTKNVMKQNDSSELFDIFKSAILKIEEGFNPLALSNIIELKYLDYLGVGLELDSCVVCGKNSVLTFSDKCGGFVCASCHSDEIVLDPRALKMLRMYKYVDISKISSLEISNTVLENIDRLLNNYYDNYTGVYLKSKKFLNDIKDLENKIR